MHTSQNNLKRENQVLLLTITNGEKWHYVAVKKFSILLRGIIPAGKYWSPRSPEDVSLQGPQDVP